MAGVKLSELARINGVNRSAARWFRAGVLPVPARQPVDGTILTEVPDRATAGIAIYARLSFSDQRADMDRQAGVSDDLVRDMVEVLTSFCARLHGGRSTKRRAELALAAASTDQAV